MSSTGAILLTFVAAVAMALLGLLLVQRMVPRERLAQHTDVAGYVYAVIGVIYAVILAQVVVAAWEEYRDARRAVAVEADSVLNLERLSQSWPSEDRSRVRSTLVTYARHVVDVEWPAMARGDFDPSQHIARLHEVWMSVDQAGQGAAGAKPSFAAALGQLEMLDAARRDRVLIGEGGLPDTMLWTLILGAIVTVGFSYLFVVDDGWVHGLMTASLAMLVALLLLLQYDLETPFQGFSAIDPTAMEFVLAEIGADAGQGQAQP